MCSSVAFKVSIANHYQSVPVSIFYVFVFLDQLRIFEDQYGIDKLWWSLKESSDSSTINIQHSVSESFLPSFNGSQQYQLLFHLDAVSIAHFEKFIKVLGVQWFSSSDNFGFKVELPPYEETTTKRKFLSHASKNFDPLGFLSPSTIIPKILFQELLELKLNWDDSLPENVAKRYDIASFELHGFADDSKVAYSAVIYSGIEKSNGKVEIHFMASKTKVAPIKKLTIPCAELCGALLLLETDIMKKKSVINLITVDMSNEILHCFSSLQKLIRVTVWCKRFIINIRRQMIERSVAQPVQGLCKQNLHQGGPRKCGSISNQQEFPDLFKLIPFLTVAELNNALKLWIQNVQ
ncbi:hypothetical protein Bhyg_03975, partial [Pseudolycoriella hygida]